MSYIELFLLAAGLCFDTFAVSLTGGICTRGSLCVRQILRIIFCFAVFQAGLTFAGWLLGYSVSDYISKVDHWVAFVLLGYIGVKMIIEGCSKKEEEVSGTSLLNTRQLVLLSVATSIDAVAVGISLAMIKLSFLKIGITTAMVLSSSPSERRSSSSTCPYNIAFLDFQEYVSSEKHATRGLLAGGRDSAVGAYFSEDTYS